MRLKLPEFISPDSDIILDCKTDFPSVSNRPADAMKLRIRPGFRPWPGLSSWSFRRKRYRSKLSAPQREVLNFKIRSDEFCMLADLKSSPNSGNGPFLCGQGICSFPSCANPWYADTNRLYPEIFVLLSNGGLWLGTDRAYSCHRP